MPIAAPETLEQTRRQAIRTACGIDGWLSPAEAALLFDVAREADGPIVEIGSWRGRSTSALGLGSLAGTGQTVYAVDSFAGVPPGTRLSADRDAVGWNSSSPELLRANLDAAGINGTVRIIPRASAEAAPEIPECGVLFVDGDHSYDAVCRDFAHYLPKLKDRGKLVVHDCHEGDPGVVQAVDDVLMSRPDEWRLVGRVDSAVVFERRRAVRHAVMLGFPGGNLLWSAARGLMQASLGAHDVTTAQSGMGWDDMNNLWVRALNAARAGRITHFAMLHSDVGPEPGWLDVLLGELDDRRADLVSTAIALKDQRGLTSTGIGDAADHWAPFRRLTMREIHALPPTFGIADTPHPDRYLLHNTGCWAADLRNPAWRACDERGFLRATLSFPIAAEVLPDGSIVHRRESEDWYFSRMIAALPLATYITRKVSATHFGETGYRNDQPWGDYLFGDEDTAGKWRASGISQENSSAPAA